MTDVILTEVEDNSGMLAAINDNFDKLETAINLTLSKANDAINTIHTTFDVNSQRLINLPAPVDGTDAARLVDITGTGSSASLPSVTGQAGKFLGTDGTSAIWTSFSTVTIPTSQITGDLTGNAANVNGTVVVGHGGTGATSLTGYVKGTGTSPLTASSTIPGSDISGNITGSAAGLTTTLAVASGGTGQTTAANAINALVPSQTGNGGKYLSTNGSVVSWQSAPSGGGGGTVTDITAGAGLTGGLITISGTISITDTGVTAASYGAASKTLTATVNSRGQLTSLAETPIAITGAQVSGDIAGNAASLTSILPVLLGGTGSSTQGGARTALGATTVGSNVFTAVDAAAARSAIGAGTGNGNGTVTSITQGTGLTFSTTPLTSTGTISIDSTVVTLTGAQTLTNKTITQPNISTIANTGVLTLPTTTDTLVGRITTDTLQNKSMSGSQNTFTNLPISALTGGPLSVALGGTGAATLTGYLKGNGLTAVTASSTIPYTDISGTSSLVTLTGTQTLTNKTIAGSQITGNITGNAANVTGTVGYANGGTNATTQAAAQANMLPTQTSNSGKFLKTNGSIASWASAPGEHYVNVMDYGATGDGVTNDSTACQAAYDAAKASPYNRVVFFPSGTYICSINLSDNLVQVIGNGAYSTTIKPPTSTGTCFTLTDASGSLQPCRISGFQFLGAGTLQGIGIDHADGTGRALVRDCYFNNFEKCVSRPHGNFQEWYYDCNMTTCKYHFYSTADADAQAGSIFITGGNYGQSTHASFYMRGDTVQSSQIIFQNVMWQGNTGYILFIEESNGVGNSGIVVRNCYNENVQSGSISVGINTVITGVAKFAYIQDCTNLQFDDTLVGEMIVVNSHITTDNCDMSYSSATTLDSASTMDNYNARWLSSQARIPGVTKSISNIEGVVSTNTGSWCEMPQHTSTNLPVGATSRFFDNCSANKTWNIVGGGTTASTSQTDSGISGLNTCQQLDFTGSQRKTHPSNTGATDLNGTYLAWMWCGKLISGTAPIVRIKGGYTMSRDYTLNDTDFVTIKGLIKVDGTRNYIEPEIESFGNCTVRMAGISMMTFTTKKAALAWMNSNIFPTS